MLNKLTEPLQFQGRALLLRAQRQRLLASNIANADTPGYVAREMPFRQALSAATAAAPAPLAPSGNGHAAHMALPGLPSSHSAPPGLTYARPSQSALDRNTVDLDRERANFADNTVRYEAGLRFLGHQAKTMLSAIQGQ